MASTVNKQATKQPALSSNDDKKTVGALRETVQIWKGNRGDGLDRVVTLRDLVVAGLADINLRSSGATLALPGTGDVTSPIADTTNNNNVSTPPAPSKLKAVGAFSGIYLSWSAPNFGNYAYTEIWRASVDDVGQATLRGTAVGNVYADLVDGGATHYYWVRFVTSNNAVRGPYNSLNGTRASTTYNPDYVLDILTKPWEQGSYNTGDYVVPSPAIQTGLWYQAQNSGNTGLTEPDWSMADQVGETVQDGEITWEAVAKGEQQVPFIIGEVSGVPVVVMNTAAYIADASIVSAKIQDLAADKITAGTITAAIELLAATVTSSLIRTSAGTGWRLLVDGRSGATYPLWYGNGEAVNASNSNFYFDQAGNVFLRGVTMTSGVITNGRSQNQNGSTFIDFGATGTELFMSVQGQIQIYADGSGNFSRVLLSAPNVVASGTYNTVTDPFGTNNQWFDSATTPVMWLIDTGINVPTNYYTSPSTQYGANATLAHGQSAGGGIKGYSDVQVVIGDGFSTGGSPPYGAIDGRIYIKLVFYGVTTGPAQIRVTQIDWKLVQL